MSANSSHRMVVGVDGSAGSMAALEWVAHLADLTWSTVEAITTWEWPASYGIALFLPTEYDPAAAADTMLRDAVKIAQDAHPGVAFLPVVVEGHPAPVLTRASRDADLLAVGSRGHGEFAGMLIGSVSEYCTLHAHCPVLVIRDRS